MTREKFNELKVLFSRQDVLQKRIEHLKEIIKYDSPLYGDKQICKYSTFGGQQMTVSTKKELITENGAVIAHILMDKYIEELENIKATLEKY